MKIAWNSEYIPVQPFDKQLAFILLPNREALYGGAAGGGKSEALLMAALQYVHVPGYAAIIFRRTLSDLKQPSSLIDRANRWLANTRAKWNGDEHCWYFPTREVDGSEGHPAKLAFGYIGESNAYTRYQSAEYQYIGFDEVTQHTEADFTYMFSRIRKTVCPKHGTKDGKPNYQPDCKLCQIRKSIPLRMRAATNPGGVGHEWVRTRYAIEPAGDINLWEVPEDDTTVQWVGKNPDRPFIQSSYRDNPMLDQEEYEKNLDQLSSLDRARLKFGNWGVNIDSRFKRSWMKFYSTRGDHFVLGRDGVGHIVPRSDVIRIFGTIDPAGSLREGQAEAIKGNDPSHTVISIWALTNTYHLLWLDMLRFQVEIPEVVEAVVNAYATWKPQYFIIESNGLGRGVAQYANRYGVRVKTLQKSKDKVVNSTAAQIRMKKGKILFPQSAIWLDEAVSEVFGWTGDPAQKDDIVDTLADAANDVINECNDDIQESVVGVSSSGPLYVPFNYI